MNIVLWVVAGLLAFAFLGAGLMKLTKPKAELEPKMSWVADVSDAQVKAVGAIEVLGAIGVILPALLDIAPILVPIAAVGLALVMVGAVVVHVRHEEPIAAAVPAIVLGALAVFLAVGRFVIEPF